LKTSAMILFAAAGGLPLLALAIFPVQLIRHPDGGLSPLRG